MVLEMKFIERRYKNFEEFLTKAEYPFIRIDMSEAEYEEEYDYYIHNYDKVKNGTYIPLWKQ